MIGEWLRLIDPASDRPVPVPEEEHAGRLAEQARAEHEALEARAARAQAQEEQARAEHEARAARARAEDEARARRASEEQARQAQQALQEALAEVARLRGEGRRPEGHR